jgi:DNA-binding HxlR family transcriptional regulator
MQLSIRGPYTSGLLQATQCAKITLVLGHDYPGQVCSIAKALEVVGERWSLLIVRDVMNRRRRFDELQKGLGIARNTLAARLQRLVEEDILEQRPYQRNPTRHEYFLTEKGLDLWPALVALQAWGDRHSPTAHGPPVLIVHKRCGGPVSDRGVCESCGEVLEARDARALPGPGVAGSTPENTVALAAR